MNVDFTRHQIETYYRRYVKLPARIRSEEVSVNCPFHDDIRPSMSINMETGLFICYTCDAKGNIFQFEALRTGEPVGKAKQAVLKSLDGVDKEVISPQIIDEAHQLLLQTRKALNWLEARGMAPETIEAANLGYGAGRIHIPIYDEDADVVNIRMHTINPQTRDKVTSRFGLGEARLYPIGSLTYQDILLVEGELDALIAVQNGFNAISSTGGAKSWRASWDELFVDKKVAICYDNDGDGRKGALKVATQLYEHAANVNIITIPVEEEGGDITDFFVDDGDPQVIQELIAEAKEFVPSADDVLAKVTDVISTTLAECSLGAYDGKHIEFTAMIAGKDLEPYMVPSHVTFSCKVGEKDSCSNCRLHDKGGRMTVRLRENKKILQLIDVTEQRQRDALCAICGVNSKCAAKRIEIHDKTNIERVFLIPDVGLETDEPYTLRTGYYIGHGLVTNRVYKFAGLATADPRSQSATTIIYKAIAHQDSISAFKLTPSLAKQLEAFQTEDDAGAVTDKMMEIAESMTQNITHVFNRTDLHIAIDLVYHSILTFQFAGAKVRRGWLEGLVLGDTRTGKSEAMLLLKHHYGVGEVILGENTSKAGLIGGLEQSRGNWVLVWGIVPLNDRRLVAIDEANGLPVESISDMSGMRSSGIAEIHKIHTQKTFSRTRLIWLSNPRSNRTLSSYSWGVTAVTDLFGRPEDIARLDFVMTTADNEVSLLTINRPLDEITTNQYDAGLCRSLIMWAWSRSEEQVIFEPEAEAAIMEYATVMGETYSSEIPIVTAADQRIKIARLSCACAARLFSCDETGEILVVRRSHVDFIMAFLKCIYNKASMSYLEFSNLMHADGIVVKENEAAIREFMVERKELMEMLMRMERLAPTDVEDILGLTRTEASAVMGQMVRWRLLTKDKYGYRRTVPFTQMLREAMASGKLGKAGTLNGMST